MKYILLTYFKDQPELINTYYRFRPVLINVLLLCAICTAILTSADKVRSLSLGFAVGIVLVNIGESVSRLRSNRNKTLTGSESVNG